MEHLETQVSDLRSFLRRPADDPSGPATVSRPAAAVSPSSTTTPRGTSDGRPAHHSPHATASPAGPRPSSNAPGGKRRADDDDDVQKQPRSKRNRYISLACTECKRRKIRCNGEQPCGRCGHLNLTCLYTANCCSNSFKDSDDYKHMREEIATLKSQVATLFEEVYTLRQLTLQPAPDHDPTSASGPAAPAPTGTEGGIPAMARGSSVAESSNMPLAGQATGLRDRPPFSQPARFRGPTSIEFTVDVAKNTLRRMGYSGERAGGVDEAGQGSDSGLAPPVPGATPNPALPSTSTGSDNSSDPLWQYDKEEMLKLCRIYKDEVAIMYPIFDVESVMDHARALADWMESARLQRLSSPPIDDRHFSDIKTLQLKIILCCGLTIQNHGRSPRATELFETMRPVISRLLIGEGADVGSLPFLNTVAGFQFLCNEEVLAWRIIGQVARLCLELGLHRRQGLFRIPEGPERRSALNTFWVTYTLDRRWSFATGLPYVVCDETIDPKLPYPDGHPYMVAMITYSKLAARIWKLVDYFDAAVTLDFKREQFETLDQEIFAWYESVPDDIKSSSPGEVPLPSAGPSYNLQRQQVWTRLRLYQIRIWLHMPVLHCASSIQQNKDLAFKVVRLAKDTIQYLRKLHDNTGVYRRLQVFYHQFLSSSIAVLFLAAAHAPVQFSDLARPEFYMALGLIKELSAKSWVSQRLWRAVHSLKHYATRLGLQDEDGDHGNNNNNNNNNSAGGPSVLNHYHDPLSISSLAGSTALPSSAMSTLHTPTHDSNSPAETGTYPPPPYSSAGTPVARGSMGPTLRQDLDRDLIRGMPLNDEQNGSALHSEMSRIFEGYSGLLPMAGSSGPGSTSTHDGPFGLVGDGSNCLGDDIGVFQQIRDMF
ncbi:fungal specific transcription factor domain-containing protein [Magnaporthiopsis poae ATCC 64411]|uniref:Fungal specific transcription factor domain-containing protein n=1 Tax=Magnaporthiopsis poae (strain ATCC 64411 / 73-15) TaxID=644358 RepID=A0A0C4DM24_MAGP6|nr:fungal specific transcription factor domain-containing protein [Magnaporthiopsis poae ATCC 64411]